MKILHDAITLSIFAQVAKSARIFYQLWKIITLCKKVQLKWFQRLCDPYQVYFQGKISTTANLTHIIPRFFIYGTLSEFNPVFMTQLQKFRTPSVQVQIIWMTYQIKAWYVYFYYGKFHIHWTSFGYSKIQHKLGTTQETFSGRNSSFLFSFSMIQNSQLGLLPHNFSCRTQW